MIVLVESQLPDALASTHGKLMVLFAGTAALGVCTMLISMLLSSYTLFRSAKISKSRNLEFLIRWFNLENVLVDVSRLLNFRSSFENKLPFYCIHGRNHVFDITVWEGRAHFKPAWSKAYMSFQIGSNILPHIHPKSSTPFPSPPPPPSPSPLSLLIQSHFLLRLWSRRGALLYAEPHCVGVD